MSRGGAHFTAQELAQVLSHFDIGIIQQIKTLNAGNQRAPKKIILSDTGRYLLKRRARGKDDLYRVTFAHAVHEHLEEKCFPLPKLLKTRDEKSTILKIEKHIYELFEYIPGSRFNGEASAVRDAGGTLAKFHKFLSDFSYQSLPIRGTFHDSSRVRTTLKKICSETEAADTESRITIEKLMTLYNNASVYVNQLGFDSWKEQVVHGDWHPGNMLFSAGKVTAVLDFESLKISPPITDLANGALQYSIVGGRPNPLDWPDYLDQEKLLAFIGGYYEIKKIDKSKLASVIDLMTETLIAEAVLPIAATGYFGNLAGADFLKMILRKCLWIKKHRQSLNDAVMRAVGK